jgi:hypothetical protein
MSYYALSKERHMPFIFLSSSFSGPSVVNLILGTVFWAVRGILLILLLYFLFQDFNGILYQAFKFCILYSTADICITIFTSCLSILIQKTLNIYAAPQSSPTERGKEEVGATLHYFYGAALKHYKCALCNITCLQQSSALIKYIYVNCTRTFHSTAH